MIVWSNGIPAGQPAQERVLNTLPEQARHIGDSNPERVRLAAEPCARHRRRPTTWEEARRVLDLAHAMTAA